MNCKLAIKHLIDCLVKKPVLKDYNAKAKRTEFHTDAFAKWLGAMVFQADEIDIPLKLVCARSRKTNEAEEK